MAGWSSGWVNTDGTTTVANGATLNFTHGLGTTDLTLSIFLADDQAGTNARFIGNNSEKGSSGTIAYDAQIKNLSLNSLTVQLGSGGYFDITTAGAIDTGQSKNFVGTFIKVVAISAVDPAPVPGTGDLCKILSADSGYQMFRNGLTIQWMSSAAFTDQDQSRTVSFPIPFASKPFKVTCSTRNPEGTGLAGVVNIETTNWTNTSVTLMSQAEGDKPEPNRPYYADIIAIGIATVTDCPALGGEDPEGIKVSELVDAQSLKDDDLFLISRDNETDGTYDTSKNVTMSSLTEGIKNRVPSSNVTFIDPVEIYSHTGYVTLPWTTKNLSAYIPEGATGCIIYLTYQIAGPDDGVFAQTFLRAESGSYEYNILFTSAFGGGDNIAGNFQGFYPINTTARSVDISIPVRSPWSQSIYVMGYF
jgi:hypothetical protein